MAKVKIDRGLFKRAKEVAQQEGYANVDEFVVHAIERAIEELEEGDDNSALDHRLRGLGYIE